MCMIIYRQLIPWGISYRSCLPSGALGRVLGFSSYASLHLAVFILNINIQNHKRLDSYPSTLATSQKVRFLHIQTDFLFPTLFLQAAKINCKLPKVSILLDRCCNLREKLEYITDSATFFPFFLRQGLMYLATDLLNSQGYT